MTDQEGFALITVPLDDLRVLFENATGAAYDMGQARRPQVGIATWGPFFSALLDSADAAKVAQDESAGCCDYRDHTYGVCTCDEHPISGEHPFGYLEGAALRQVWNVRFLVELGQLGDEEGNLLL